MDYHISKNPPVIMSENKFVIVAHINGEHMKLVKNPEMYFPSRELAELVVEMYAFDERVYQFEIVEVEGERLEISDIKHIRDLAWNWDD